MKMIAAIVAALTLSLTGCGSEDDPATPVSPTTKAKAPTGAEQRADNATQLDQFIRDADRICARFNREWVGYTGQNLAPYYHAWEASTAQLRQLDAPEEVAIEWRQYLAAIGQQLRYDKEGNAPQAKAADSRKEAVAQKIGFAQCGTG